MEFGSESRREERVAPRREQPEPERPAEERLRGERPGPGARLTARSAMVLQGAAGNRAVSRLVAQRKAATKSQAAPKPPTTAPPSNGTAVPATASAAVDTAAPTGEVETLPAVQRAVEAPARPGPAADPKFTALKRDVKSKQRTLGKHPPAKAEADAVAKAAKPPQDDREAQGKAANAEKMNAAKPGEFDKAAFIKAVNDAIAKQAPKNLDEADKFGTSGKADAVKGEVSGKVEGGKKASAGAIESTTKAPPDVGAAKDKPVTPLKPDQPPAKPGTPDPAKAIPDKAPPAATDFSEGPKQVNESMAEAQVTEEQLAKSNEPEFTGALREKKAGEQHAATAPGELRAKETTTLSGAKAQAQQAGATAMAGMTAVRTKSGKEVAAGKGGAQSEDEKKRAQVTAKLQTVFDATKRDVEAILTGLDKKVDEAFTKGEKAARDAFTAEHKRKMDAYKDRRYSGLIGKGRWLKDKFAGLPEEANQIFVQARAGYVTAMQGVISTVADLIGAELNRAKARIAQGRAELKAEVDKLPKDLQALGKEAAADFAGKFDELTESVDAKGSELVDVLASKYTEALKAVDEEIAAEKEKNKGLIAKAMDAVAGVIKTILQLKDLLLGVLAKAAQAVGAIIKDPIGFLGNLISAVGAGLKNFIANIGTHLKKGLVSWLLGTAAKAGLQLPEKFDLKGILGLIASLLGLTWASIRGRIVARGVPEQAMGAVEAGVPMVQKIMTGGIGGLWEELKEKVGDLKETLLGKVTEYLVPTVLIAGITWIVSLLNPASAFIKACKAIIDIVTFIITRGAQILEFVNAVLDAVIAIAAGGTGGAPALIENALAKSIPVLIGFLAALLGIGGVADKVKKIFQALSKPVMKAVDWVVGKIVGFAKKIWAKLKGKAGKVRDRFRKPGVANSDRKALAVREAEVVLTKRPSRQDADVKIGGLARRYDVPLRVIVESKTPTTERVHVQAMSTDSHDLPAGNPAEESEEVKLLDDGKTSAQERQKVLSDVRGVVQNESVIGTILQVMRNGQIKKANRIGILQKLIALGEKDGYRLTLRQRVVDGRDQLDMEYYGVFCEQAIKVGNVRPGGTRAVGEAWVEPKSIGTGDTPVEALAMDFLVDPKIELAGVKGLGSRMFTMAAEHFKTRYEAVAGEWYTLEGYASKAAKRPAMSKNLIEYLAARKASLSPEDAVRATWTYRRVKQLYGGVELQVQVEELPNLDLDNPPVGERIVRCLMRP